MTKVMHQSGTLRRLGRAAKGILNLFARPVRTAQGRSGIVLEPYRGYGSQSEVFLIGRVYRQSHSGRSSHDDQLSSQLRDIGRRLARRTIAGAVITARFCGAEERVTTDQDGYFRVHLHPRTKPSPDDLWHPMNLVLEEPQRVEAQGQIFIPSSRCRYVVISDIDDTIMHTGVGNKLGMLWRLFVEGAQSRVAFPGVAALYRALHAGVSGHEANPILYVSRAPWGIYGVLEEFFNLHGIPVGPVLFLREWGVSWRSPLPRKAEAHKQDLIRAMLTLYSDLPFVLIGDSGQHDPEVYRQIVEEHPGRVLAVYIRNVSRGAGRIAEIEGLAKAVAEAGSSLVLAADSVALAEHAVGLGLIRPEAVADAVNEKSTQEDVGSSAGTRQLTLPTKAETARAVAGGELQNLLESAPDGRLPNVIVEPASGKAPEG